MDPLDSFTSLIRSLSRRRAERTQTAGSNRPGEAQSVAPSGPVRTGSQLEDRLRSRLAALRGASRQRRCEAFVETVLLFELSETAGVDPQFADLVGRVVEELASEPGVGARLDEILIELQNTPDP